MHICLVTSGRPSEVFYGGEERFILSFGNWLIKHNYNITIIGRKLFGVVIEKSFKKPKSEINSAIPRVLKIPYLIYIFCMLITTLFMSLKIIYINKKSRIHIIHSQDTGYGGLSAILSAKVLRIPVIISSHGIRYITLKNNLMGVSGKLSLIFEYFLDIFTTKNSDLIISVSSTVEKYFARLKVRKNKIITIPVGIEVNNFQNNKILRQITRRNFGISKDYVIIGFIGRFSPEKNLLTLLDAFAEASSCIAKIKLILVGTGPLDKNLRLFCCKRNLEEKVIFTGVIFDVKSILSALDIFVLPSYTEGCPISLLEAMASGKAIIASNIPAIREIVGNRKEALLFDPHDVKQLKNLIITLYNNPKLRKELGENARKKVEQYDVNAVFNKIGRLYYDVLKNLKY